MMNINPSINHVNNNNDEANIKSMSQTTSDVEPSSYESAIINTSSHTSSIAINNLVVFDSIETRNNDVSGPNNTIKNTGMEINCPVGIGGGSIEESYHEEVRERDHEPLIIRPPPKQGKIHKFLSNVKLGNGPRGTTLSPATTSRETNPFPPTSDPTSQNKSYSNNSTNGEPSTSSNIMRPSVIIDRNDSNLVSNNNHETRNINKETVKHRTINMANEIDPRILIIGPHYRIRETITNCINENNNRENLSPQLQNLQHSALSENNNSRSSNNKKCSIGILLAALSCIFFATTSLIVKISTIHPMELLATRGFVQGLLVLPIVISSKSNILGNNQSNRSLLLARGVLGSASLILAFISIHLIPLADSSTVIFTSPVFVSIFACLCLGEICTWFDNLLITLTLLGVIFVSKPSFNFLNSGSSWDCIIGTFCGLLAAMFTALAFIVMRQLKGIHYSIIILWFSIILTFFGSILTIALDVFIFPTNAWNIMECLSVGICGFLGQILLTKALQIETATTVSIARTLDIVIAFLYQIVLLHDTPDLFSCLGSILVVSCVVLTACRSHILVQLQAIKGNNSSSVISNNNMDRGSICSRNTIVLDQEDVA